MLHILQPGQSAPDFSLVSHLSGEELCLRSVCRRGNVLLVFYPGDFAPT